MDEESWRRGPTGRPAPAAALRAADAQVRSRGGPPPWWRCQLAEIVVANCGRLLGRCLGEWRRRPSSLSIQVSARVIYWTAARVSRCPRHVRAPSDDSYLKPFVISEPEITVTERTDEDECLILASDGLWDVVSNETACDVVRMCLRGDGRDKACSDAAMLLTKLALARQSADNVSVVVVDLRRNLL
ncbi:uncharacterized protein A4U43_C07F1310 [Asparagus officinalis]|uniref:protein-serine/threonine phosphatase n=1 Tax=Asparagus officinalis TaxID=4686 RepID=A0A5P1EDF3_ASPOF|nr:uncharacterized protein A4U43_C07F1310 [Asparagus officinalis]